MYYAICDCDNCFVSCERVFRPDLEGKPVVVLSNNDGCVVSRSPEAKQLGIKMGMPYYQMRRCFDENTVVAFSSNYELYSDMTARVMHIIRRSAPSFFRYSVDEAFCLLPDMKAVDIRAWGENLSSYIGKATGMPLSIGVAKSKTLAKTAVHFAKKYAGYNHCCIIADDMQRMRALELTDVGDIWGIGRRMVTRLNQNSIMTAAEFISRDMTWIRSNFNIGVERTWRELRGEDCIPDEVMVSRKSAMISRSFEHMIEDLATLRTHVANFAARGAGKIRNQGMLASIVSVFIVTNRFRNDMEQYCNMFDVNLGCPTASTVDIVGAADQALRKIYREGFKYKKAGVVLAGLSYPDGIQLDLFEYSPERAAKMERLDRAIDMVNTVQRCDMLTIAAQKYDNTSLSCEHDHFSDITRHDHKSPSPTTRWKDILILR